MIEPLNERTLFDAAQRLAQREPFFAQALARRGPPPLWARPPGFATLVWLILEQQVSLASARAAFERLQARLGVVTPAGLLPLDDAELKAIGFSRQKMGYARILAQATLNGDIDLDALAQQDDDAVRQALTALKGIGPWTANVYLLMALGRPDVWPAQDLGLIVAAQRGLSLEHPPTPAGLEALAEAWRPYRSVAARFFWHYYLSKIRPPRAPGPPA